MKTPKSAFPKDWQVGVEVWAERAGQAIFDKGRLEFLEEIHRCRSISAAARSVGVSYRHAWLMVQGMNEAAGEPLVVSATGGHHGGGAQLTNLGRWTVAVFREMQGTLQQSATALFRKATAASTAASIHVAAAVCLEEVLGQLLTDFTVHQPELRVRAVFGASDELADHVLAGAPVDLFITAGPEPLHRLEAAGIAERKTRTVLAENVLAAIGPADGDVPVRSCADLTRAGVQRIALAEPTCPLGRYTRDYLDILGLYDRLHARAVYVDNSRAVGAAVRARRADVGLVYGSDAVAPAGCRLLFTARKGPSPMELAGEVVHQGQQAANARTLLGFLASREAASRFRQCGFRTPR